MYVLLIQNHVNFQRQKRKGGFCLIQVCTVNGKRWSQTKRSRHSGRKCLHNTCKPRQNDRAESSVVWNDESLHFNGESAKQSVSWDPACCSTSDGWISEGFHDPTYCQFKAIRQDWVMVKWINTGCHEASRRRWRTGSEKLKETCSWYGALACQLACDPLSDWRCSSSAAYGEVWLWNRFCWNLLTACCSALNLCLYICTLVGGWFIILFFSIRFFTQEEIFIFHAYPMVVLHVGHHSICGKPHPFLKKKIEMCIF